MGSLLLGGASRSSIIVGFSESAEYKALSESANDTLDGSAGDDHLHGGRGNDIYVFDASEPGSDHVYGLEAWDTLRFAGFGYADASAALANLTVSGANVVFADQGETITFHDTTIARLNAVSYTLG